MYSYFPASIATQTEDPMTTIDGTDLLYVSLALFILGALIFFYVLIRRGQRHVDWVLFHRITREEKLIRSTIIGFLKKRPGGVALEQSVLRECAKYGWYGGTVTWMIDVLIRYKHIVRTSTRIGTVCRGEERMQPCLVLQPAGRKRQQQKRTSLKANRPPPLSA
jgi:hypothetical protein